MQKQILDSIILTSSRALRRDNAEKARRKQKPQVWNLTKIAPVLTQKLASLGIESVNLTWTVKSKTLRLAKAEVKSRS
jgi:hypothetical protein